MQTGEEELRAIWNQGKIPVILRRSNGGEKHRLRIPFATDNKSWISLSGKSKPEWIRSGRFWEIPNNWFNNFVNNSIKRYGKIYIIQPYRETEICAPACMNAMGHVCQCSCMGANHGAGNDGSWFEVSDSFAVKTHSYSWACRLLVRKPQFSCS